MEFSSPLTYKNVYQVPCTKQKVPDYTKIHKSLQNCEWDMLHVTLLAPRIWKWHLHFWKICEAWPNKC